MTYSIGFGATQGVFREYYFKNPPFKGNQLVASIGLLVVVSIMSSKMATEHLLQDVQLTMGRGFFKDYRHFFFTSSADILI